MSKILLFNASGAQGTAISTKLQAKGYSITAPVRSEKSKAILQARGIDAHLSDFSKTSLLPLIQQVDKVVLQVPAQVSPALMIQFANNALEAIHEAGSPPTLFVISSTIPVKATGKASPDARLIMKNKALALLPDAVIFSATEYLENFSTSYRSAIEQEGMIPQTIPDDLPVNYLSWQDLAVYVEAALSQDLLQGGFYPIGGKEGITGKQLAKRLGDVLDRSLMYHTLTHEQLAGFLTPVVGAQLAAELAEFYEWQDTIGSHLLNPDTAELRSRLGIDLPDFEEWAQEAFGGSTLL